MVETKVYKALDEETIALMPDTTKVRNHLIVNGSITPLEAWRMYGITRLSAVIYKLRYRMHPLMDIVTEMEYGRDRYNQPTQYGKYILKEIKDA